MEHDPSISTVNNRSPFSLLLLHSSFLYPPASTTVLTTARRPSTVASPLYSDHVRYMEGRRSYEPPPYIPLGQSNQVVEVADEEVRVSVSGVPEQWSSGICACCDDMPSCCIGFLCPCYLFAKNAEFLGSQSLFGPCMTHFALWAVVNIACCFLTDGILLGLPGCCISCYAANYRRTLRSKYNLQEAPCGDFVTHFFCHLCAVCQEYREIRERSGDPNYSDLQLRAVTPPPVQKMELSSEES